MSLKQLTRETLIYGSGTVLGRFLNFILVPFYVNVLPSPAEYGVVTSLYTFMAFLNMVYGLGMESAYFRYGARPEGEPLDPEKEKAKFSPAFWLVLSVGGFFSFLLALGARWGVGGLFYDPGMSLVSRGEELAGYIRIAALILWLDALALLPLAVHRLEHEALRFSWIRFSGVGVTVGLNLLFVLRWRWGVSGILWANVGGSLWTLAWLLPVLGRRLAWRWDRALFKKYLPFGLATVPASLAAMMVQVIDRPIVQGLLGLGALGVYQANYRMGFIMMVFVSLFEYSWRPFFMRQALKDDGAARILFARVLTVFGGLMMVAFLGLSFILPWLLRALMHGHRLLKPDYWAGIPIIPVVLLAYVFQGFYTNFIAGIYIKERARVLPWITGLGAMVNVSANLVLIPRMGLMGAAWATLLAYVAMALALYVESHRVYPVPYPWSVLGRMALVVGAGWGLSTLWAPKLTPGGVGLLQCGLFVAAASAVTYWVWPFVKSAPISR